MIPTILMTHVYQIVTCHINITIYGKLLYQLFPKGVHYTMKLFNFLLTHFIGSMVYLISSVLLYLTSLFYHFKLLSPCIIQILLLLFNFGWCKITFLTFIDRFTWHPILTLMRYNAFNSNILQEPLMRKCYESCMSKAIK